MTDAGASWLPPSKLLRWTAIAVCLLILGGTAVAGAVLLSELRLVVLPLVIAAFLTRILVVPANGLERRGWRPAPRTVVVLLGFLAGIVGLVSLIAPPVADEFSGLGPILEDGVAQVEDWIVEDSPFDLTRPDLERLKEQAGDQIRTQLEGSPEQVAAGAARALEVLAGIILGLILTFFAVKDGKVLQAWLVRKTPADKRPEAVAMANASWTVLGGYLRGAALLGLVEGIVIGVAMYFVGAELVIPMMVLTFVAAFVPIVGATVAGIVAVLVTLATAGFTEAIIIAVVAVLVQQFDNDLLAPWIYGKALEMHPATILLAITTGTALFGFAGTILAVPVTAVAVAAYCARRDLLEGDDADRAAVAGSTSVGFEPGGDPAETTDPAGSSDGDG